MQYTYVLHPIAQEEFEDSIRWYLSKSVSTAQNFVTEIDYALNLICSKPFIWRNEYLNYYEFSLKKYPFTIVYIVDKNTIVVLAIYHQKRTNKYKYR